MSNRLAHINQLDGLRALSAIIIVVYHFLIEFNFGHLPYGWMGVDLFFLISGYLITAILLEQKESINNKTIIIKNFFVKRVLRLFPIYYLVISFFLCLMYFFKLYVWDKGDEIYYYTYTENLLFYKEGMKGVQLNHLWSLAVEEQFYIVWPWLILFIKNRTLIKMIGFIVISTLIIKSIFTAENLRMLPFFHLDTIGSGALIGLLIKERKEGILLQVNKIKILLIISSLVILFLAFVFNVSYFFVVVSVLILSFTLVIGCYYNFSFFLGWLLNLKVLKYLGKISYGIYLFHKPIPYFMNLITNKINFRLDPIILIFISIFITLLIAILSFKFIEKPFLKMKEKFDV